MKPNFPIFLGALTKGARRWWVLIFLLLLLLLVLFSPHIQKNPRVAFLERPLVAVVTGLQGGISTLFGGVVSVWDRYVALVNLRSENQRLKAEIQMLQIDRITLQEEAMEAARLRRHLLLRDRIPIPTVSAQIIGRDSTNWYRMAVLNKGEDDGIVASRAVISPEGVVGRVIKTAPDFARVLLISDRSSAVSVIVRNSRVAGILEGGEAGRLSLQYIPLEGGVAPRDIVLTSGLDGIFPKGIPVGRVTRVDRKSSPLFLHVEVAPLVDISRIEEVEVLKGTDFPDLEKVWEEGVR
jgi:rod shape-determining protein MreC